MARFTANEAENYSNQGNGSFFKLEDDKDVALVRLMYNSAEDVEGFAVHEIEIDGKRRMVNCLRAYNEPVENCPMCADGQKLTAKIFVFLYDIDAEEVKIWERGKTILSKISGLGARYNPLVSMPFEIERNGKKGDTSTKYEFYPTEADDVTLDDLPEIPEILGNIVLDKTVEELEDFLVNGYFEEEEAKPVTRKKSEPVSRRTSVPAGRSNTRTVEPKAVEKPAVKRKRF
jgi:hypothetical protein